jgi:hypothetical protein
MIHRIWLVCHVCKCEFPIDFVRLQQQPQRSCPNCLQLFDIRGMGLLVQALEELNQAAGTVKFRLEGDQRLLEIARVVRAAQAMGVPRQTE